MIDSTQSFRFFNRGPSPVARLVFFAVLSLLLLFVDARYRYLESTRSALSVLVSPIQWLATLPSALWQQAGDFFITQSTQRGLIKQNDDLGQQHQSDAAQLLQLQALQLENQQLRNLAALPIRNEFTSQLVEVIYAERDVFKRDGMWLTAGEWGGPRDSEPIERRVVRYRTVGDMSCTGAVESTAADVAEVIAEIAVSTITERGATRADDKLSEAAMEDRKREGYF